MKNFILLLVITMFIFTSCEKFDIDSDSSFQQTKVTNEELIQIIEKLENPYSLANMKKAYASLQKEGLMMSQVNINTTHLYVRFSPKDSLEYEAVKCDSSLTLFSYPLDCKLTEGEKFIDSAALSNFGCLYTRVPVNYISPISGYEVLTELYLPLIDEEEKNHQCQQRIKSNSDITPDIWQLLENRSMELTGNTSKKTIVDEIKKAKWYPQATIKVYDDWTGTFIPVEGAIVRARNWFNWEKAKTDANGWCKMPDNFSNASYSIIWEGAYWDIRDGMLIQAYYNGPDDSEKNWNLNINSGKSKAYAHVHRACYSMFHKNPLGAGMPRIPSRIKISVYNTNSNNHLGMNVLLSHLGLSQIHLHMLSNEIPRQSYELFGTTVHELTHSSHMNEFPLGLIQFAFVSNFIIESWARYVQWSVTRWEYDRIGFPMFDAASCYAQEQNWHLTKTDYRDYSKYSPLFIDLSDNYNQYWAHSSYEYPDDNVSGFTVRELRGIIDKVFDISDLKKQVKALRSDSTTKANIDKLFETYEKTK